MYRYVLNINIVILLGDPLCMELHYSFTDYPYSFPMYAYL